MEPLDSRVWLVTYRDLTSEFSGEEDQVLFPRTLTPELKAAYPNGLVEMSEEKLRNYIKWINHPLKGSDIVDRVLVGCDDTDPNNLRRKQSVVLFVKPWKS